LAVLHSNCNQKAFESIFGTQWVLNRIEDALEEA
jgi:hypothetical protein